MTDIEQLPTSMLNPDILKAAHFDGSTVFVDFDHTLLASNSTELFISCCKPSILVSVIDFCVRRCIPWQLSGLSNWIRVRDYFCCVAIMILAPWNNQRWKRIAPALFEQQVSADVAETLRGIDARRIVIISFGLEFVIEAMLQGSKWASARLIATPKFPKLSHFTNGKLAMALSHAGSEVVARSTFITDSLDDRDLLLAAKVKILIERQGARFQAMTSLYFPLRYAAKAKYSSDYLFDQVIAIEFVLLLISTSQSINAIGRNFFIIALLYLSILCVYEIGYFENDMVAARLEERPALTSSVERFRQYPIVPDAYIWAFGAGFAGNLAFCYFYNDPYRNLIIRCPVWIMGLIALRIVFHFYNKPSLRLRLHLYPALQLMKFLPILVLLSGTAIGAILIFGQISMMWAIYLTYRHGGRPKDIEKELYRAISIVLGIGLMATTGALANPGWKFQVIATGIWSVARLSKAARRRLLGPVVKRDPAPQTVA